MVGLRQVGWRDLHELFQLGQSPARALGRGRAALRGHARHVQRTYPARSVYCRFTKKTSIIGCLKNNAISDRTDHQIQKHYKNPQANQFLCLKSRGLSSIYNCIPKYQLFRQLVRSIAFKKINRPRKLNLALNSGQLIHETGIDGRWTVRLLTLTHYVAAWIFAQTTSGNRTGTVLKNARYVLLIRIPADFVKHQLVAIGCNWLLSKLLI